MELSPNLREGLAGASVHEHLLGETPKMVAGVDPIQIDTMHFRLPNGYRCPQKSSLLAEPLSKTAKRSVPSRTAVM